MSRYNSGHCSTRLATNIQRHLPLNLLNHSHKIRKMADPLDMLLWLIAFLAIVCSFHFFSMKASKLPPGPVGLPFVGSLFQVGSKVNESLAELSQVYGPLMTLKLGFKTIVVVSSTEAAAEILQKHDQAFAGKLMLLWSFLVAGDSLFAHPSMYLAVPESQFFASLLLAGRAVMDAANILDISKYSLSMGQNGPRWRELRRICNNELFTPNRLDALRGLREQKVHELLLHIQATCSAGEHAVDIGECALVTALNSISNTLFSQDAIGLGSESATEFKVLLGDHMETFGVPNMADFFPFLRFLDPQGLRRRAKTFVVRLFETFDEIIDKRRASYASASGRVEKRSDFLDVLLGLSAKPGLEFTAAGIKHLLLDMFLAGSETSATTIEWAMAELLRHPEKMDILRCELKEAIAEGHAVEEPDVLQLPYLQAVVKETLRLHPPLPLLIPHRADTTTEVAGFTILEHTEVLVNVWAISRDVRHWENPTSFLPERFVKSDVNFKGKDFQFIPFGAGRRVCPGMSLGIRTVHLVIASLVHSFSWKLPERMAPEHLDMEDRFGITMRKAVPLQAVASPLMVL